MTYTVETLAERWGVNPMTVRRLISDGKIHAFKVGRVWRISDEEVRRFENQ